MTLLQICRGIGRNAMVIWQDLDWVAQALVQNSECEVDPFDGLSEHFVFWVWQNPDATGGGSTGDGETSSGSGETSDLLDRAQ